MKEQEAKGLLSSSGLKTPLRKVPLLGDIMFWVYKMNGIVNKFVLAGYKFMLEMYLKQPEFTCGLFTKNKKKQKKLKNL